MTTLKEFDEICSKDSSLREKYHSEFSRLIESGEAANDMEAVIKAAKSVGYDIPQSELEKANAAMEELDEDSLDQVSGGRGFTSTMKCNVNYSFQIIPPKKPENKDSQVVNPGTIGTDGISEGKKVITIARL